TLLDVIADKAGVYAGAYATHITPTCLKWEEYLNGMIVLYWQDREDESLLVNALKSILGEGVKCLMCQGRELDDSALLLEGGYWYGLKTFFPEEAQMRQEKGSSRDVLFYDVDTLTWDDFEQIFQYARRVLLGSMHGQISFRRSSWVLVRNYRAQWGSDRRRGSRRRKRKVSGCR
ncbi:MAG: hypothetical protein GDA50_08890, partial [Alphaproteobacteria bacterium GM202ARS2]|nr:hypothetical protein [Alphaproteobacteria bacterium GM202ARS2]